MTFRTLNVTASQFAGIVAKATAQGPEDPDFRYKVADISPQIEYYWAGTGLGYLPFGGGLGDGIQPYIGQVATRCGYLPRNKDATNTVGMFRSLHIFRDTAAAPQVEFPNFVATNGTTTTYNALLRNELRTDAGGYVDIADFEEVGPNGLPSRDSGIWAFNGNPNAYAFDQLHESSQMNKWIQKSGSVRQSIGL